MSHPQIDIQSGRTETVLSFSGRLVTDALHLVEKPFTQINVETRQARLDLSGLEALDTAGACLITTLQRRLTDDGIVLDIEPGTRERARLLQAVAQAQPAASAQTESRAGPVAAIERIGEGTIESLKGGQSFLSFIGLVVSRLLRLLIRPKRLRGAALFTQMQETGLNAIPIVALMGFLIGIVLAYQGAAQLRQFGAEVFVVDLIAVSVLRELGILLTAIIVAGRSGSAYAAAIGSMKVNQEIDAMRTLGLDPTEVLVLPRVLALVLMLPVLGLVSNVSALIGGALMSWIELGVSPDMFVTRFRENTDIWHLLVGMIKAPVFAVIIAIVACWQGMQVAASADSVGQRTRASVVQAIFLVIVMDAIFSVFFAELGV